MIPEGDVDDKIQEALITLVKECECQNDIESLQVIYRLVSSVGLRLNYTYGKDIALIVFNAVTNIIIELNDKKVVVQ